MPEVTVTAQYCRANSLQSALTAVALDGLVAEGEEEDERSWKWWWFVILANFSFHAHCFNATFTLSEVGSSTANSGVSLVLFSTPSDPTVLFVPLAGCPAYLHPMGFASYAYLVLHVATFHYLDASYEQVNMLFAPLVVTLLTFSVKCLYIS